MASIIFACIIISSISLASTAKLCQMTDFHPEFTECDSEKGRWRVWVPKADCEGGTPPKSPQRYPNCETHCEPGKYLDMYDDLICKPCPAGSYSLGVSQRFDNWTRDLLNPELFTIINDKQFNGYSSSQCTYGGWQIIDNRMVTVLLDSACSSELTFSAKLSQVGKVRFTYQYTDPSINFQFDASNGRCSGSFSGPQSSMFQPVLTNFTDIYRYETFSMSLPIGVNILKWTVSRPTQDWYSDPDTTYYAPLANWLAPPVRIVSVEVSGVSFVPQCTPCPAGSFSLGGNASCTLCPPNTFARSAASMCSKCSDDQYADAGSESCRKRPNCTEQDYFLRPGACVGGYAEARADWILPRICVGGVSLPNRTEKVPCRKCNPGMTIRWEGTNGANATRFTCDFCPRDRPYSDEDSVCRTCPANTITQFGIAYHWFHEMPAMMHSACLPSGADRCPGGTNTWQPAGSYMQTSPLQYEESSSSEDSSLAVYYQSLFLHVKDGFIAPSIVQAEEVEYAKLTVELEVSCQPGHNCSLTLGETRNHWFGSSRENVIHEWTQTFSKLTFSHPIRSPNPATFSFTFSYSSSSGANSSSAAKGASIARIYSILLTNVEGAGAINCKKCSDPFGRGCMPCDSGSYMKSDGTCAPCPANSVSYASKLYSLVDNVPKGIESCIACGPGLEPNANRSRCVLNCARPLSLDHDSSKNHSATIDLSAFAGVHTLASRRVFSPQGLSFYYVLSLTVCEYNTAVRCVPPRRKSKTNSSETGSIRPIYTPLGLLATPDKEHVESGQMACYATVLPDYLRESTKSENNSATQQRARHRPNSKPSLPGDDDGILLPVNLGSSIQRVLAPGVDLVARRNFTAVFGDAGYDISSADSDVFIVYESADEGDAYCPAGRHMLLSLRCDMDAPVNASDAIQLPPDCPEGTCDGCVFLAMWRSPAACRVCNPLTDIRTVLGECVRGKQKIYHQPLPNCFNTIKSRVETRSCPFLSLEAYVIVGVVGFLGLISCIAALVFRAKTKKLEHKYMRLVQEAGGQYGGEMTGAESCAVQEGELDESAIDDQTLRHKRIGSRRKNKLDDDQEADASEDDELNVKFKKMQLRPMSSESSEPRVSALSRILGRLTNHEDGDRGASLMNEDEEA